MLPGARPLVPSLWWNQAAVLPQGEGQAWDVVEAGLPTVGRPSTSCSECPHPHPHPPPTHPQGYKRMGTAWVECVSGCECKRSVLDGTWKQQATLMQIFSFKVRFAGAPSFQFRLVEHNPVHSSVRVAAGCS